MILNRSYYRLDVSVDSGLAISKSQSLHRRGTSWHVWQCDTGHCIAWNLLVDCEMLMKGERDAVGGGSPCYTLVLTLPFKRTRCLTLAAENMPQTMTLPPLTKFNRIFDILWKKSLLCSIYVVHIRDHLNPKIKCAPAAKMDFGPVVIRSRNMLFSKYKSSNFCFADKGLDVQWPGFQFNLT